MKKKILVISVCLFIIVNLFTPIWAEPMIKSKDENSNVYAVTPRWWPGNPNPEPGSEAWLQNHMYLPAPSEKARSCAYSTLINTTLTSGVSAWLSRATLTAYSFGITFGAEYLVSYALCVFS